MFVGLLDTLTSIRPYNIFIFSRSDRKQYTNIIATIHSFVLTFLYYDRINVVGFKEFFITVTAQIKKFSTFEILKSFSRLFQGR